MPVPPTLGVVINTEGFRESWNLSCLSVSSSLPISAYMWNISTLSTKNFVRHHLKWRTSLGRGQNWTAFGGGCAAGSAFSFLSFSRRSTSLDSSSWSGLEYSAGTIASITRNVSFSHWKMGESTQVLSGHTSYHCQKMSLQFAWSPSTNEKHSSHHLWTLLAPEAPHEVYLSTRVYSSAFSSSVYSRSMRCEFSFGIWTSGFPLASFDSDHLLIIQGFPICIIWCAPSCWASLFLIRIPCIKLFTAKYNASALCFSITVSSSGSSGVSENSHIVW